MQFQGFTARNWVPALPTPLNSISSPKDSLCKLAHVITQLQNPILPSDQEQVYTHSGNIWPRNHLSIKSSHTPWIQPIKINFKTSAEQTNDNYEDCSSPSPGLQIQNVPRTSGAEQLLFKVFHKPHSILYWQGLELCTSTPLPQRDPHY